MNEKGAKITLSYIIDGDTLQPKEIFTLIAGDSIEVSYNRIVKAEAILGYFEDTIKLENCGKLISIGNGKR